MSSGIGFAALPPLYSFQVQGGARDQFGKSMRWAHQYVRPRPGTGGNFEQHDYVQSLMHAAGSGFSFMGMAGVAVTGASALASTFVGRHTQSRVGAVGTGVLTGTVAAAGMACASGATGPAALSGLLVAGALLGGYQAMSGDHHSRVRDAAEGAIILTGFLMPGTSKIAGSIGAGVGACFENRGLGVLAAGAVGGVIGAALGAAGYGLGGMALSAGISAAGAVVGTLVGPPLNQGVRNLSNDCGRGFTHVARRAGVSEGRLSENTANALGAFPATFLREGTLGLVASDFSIGGFLANGLMESVETAYILVKARHEPQALQTSRPYVPPTMQVWPAPVRGIVVSVPAKSAK
jgi:hypothetical protein